MRSAGSRAVALRAAAELPQTLLQIFPVHHREHLDVGLHSAEARLGNTRKLGAVLEVEDDESGPDAVLWAEVGRLGLELRKGFLHELGQRAIRDCTTPRLARRLLGGRVLHRDLLDRER